MTDRTLGGDEPYVIAEVGNNHEGDLTTARELVEEAAACGVDGVKFQTFQAEAFVRPHHRDRLEQMRRFELDPEEFGELADEAQDHDLDFISTPLDLPSVETLDPLVDAFKIASGDNDFYPLLAEVAERDCPVIASTGVSDLEQIHRTHKFLEEQGATEVALLHCVSSYPVPPGDANLRSIQVLAERFPDAIVGYSDHTLGVEASIGSVVLGSRIVEKHFTLSNDFSDFRDHQLAADPAEMEELVRVLDRVHRMLGDREVSIQASESENASAIRRSIVAAKDLEKGTTLEQEHLNWQRPRDALPPGEEEEVRGRTLSRSLEQGEPIRPDDFH